MAHAMVEQENVETERALANRLFAWLQQADDTLPPPLNSQAQDLLGQLSVDRDTLPELRSLINGLNEEYVLPLRIYVSGFDEHVVRQLDGEGVFDDAREALMEVCYEAFAPAVQEESQVEAKDVNEPEPSIPVTVAVVATRGIKRTRSLPAKTTKRRAERTEIAVEPADDELRVTEVPDDNTTDAEVEKLASTKLDADTVKQYLKEIARHPLLNAVQEVELARGIEVGILAQERLDRLGDQLTSEEQAELEFLSEQGAKDKAQFTQANLRLVVSIAKRYAGRGIQFLDIIQEGNLGLIRAVEKFDYEKGYKFSTYATWWIRQAITRSLADKGREIRLPVHMFELVKKVDRVQRQMLQDMSREPTLEELAKELDMKPEKVMEVQQYGQHPVSLQASLGEEGDGQLGDIIKDADEVDIADGLLTNEAATKLRDIVETLPEREAFVLGMRHGIFDGRPRTLEEIGVMLDLTRERIRQIEAKSMSKLRHPSRAHLLTGLKRSRDS